MPITATAISDVANERIAHFIVLDFCRLISFNLYSSAPIFSIISSSVISSKSCLYASNEYSLVDRGRNHLDLYPISETCPRIVKMPNTNTAIRLSRYNKTKIIIQIPNLLQGLIFENA
jgi:hypothetical protein